MRLVIHAGASKTGTSALQHMLSLAYEANSARGVLYPLAGRWLDGSHHELAFALRPLPHLASSKPVEAILDDLRLEIAASQPQTVVISSELFPYLLEDARFAAFADAFSEVVLAYVVRRQSDLLLSLYNQVVKDPVQAFTGTLFECFIANVRGLNFYEVIKRWRTSRIHRVEIATYSDGYLPGFLRRLGVPVGPDAEASMPRINVSLPHVWLELVREANGHLQTMQDRERFVELVQTMDPSLCPAKREFYSVAEQEAVDSFFELGNREIARSLLGRSELFAEPGYRSIEVVTALPAAAIAKVITNSGEARF